MKELINNLIYTVLTGWLLLSGQPLNAQSSSTLGQFSFAFLTDLHLNHSERANSFGGFEMVRHAVDHAGVDFVITGGDNVDVDGMKAGGFERAVELYARYSESIKNSPLNWHFTIGNHDRFWHHPDTPSSYGEELFRSFFGDTYYTFDHKGWKFITLNTTEVCDGQYCVSEQQQAWLQQVLDATSEDQPIVLSVHVPFLSLYYPVLEGRYTQTDTFVNQKQIFDLFADYNLKLVLQGHQHLYEEIKVKGVQFITAGAVSASWWHGAFHGTEEGYLRVDVNGEEFDWEYVDYGWEVTK